MNFCNRQRHWQKALTHERVGSAHTASNKPLQPWQKLIPIHAALNWFEGLKQRVPSGM
jgi:hypothetical protein